MEDDGSMHHMLTAATFIFLLINQGSFSLGRHITNKRNHNNNFRLSTKSCQPPPLLMARTYATSK